MSELATLGSNLAIAGALCAAFRAGDNFGFHMGADESQCTCQWSPNTHGEAYRGATRCEQEEYEDEAIDMWNRADTENFWAEGGFGDDEGGADGDAHA